MAKKTEKVEEEEEEEVAVKRARKTRRKKKSVFLMFDIASTPQCDSITFFSRSGREKLRKRRIGKRREEGKQVMKITNAYKENHKTAC